MTNPIVHFRFSWIISSVKRSFDWHMCFRRCQLTLKRTMHLVYLKINLAILSKQLSCFFADLLFYNLNNYQLLFCIQTKIRMYLFLTSLCKINWIQDKNILTLFSKLSFFSCKPLCKIKIIYSIDLMLQRLEKSFQFLNIYNLYNQNKGKHYQIKNLTIIWINP